MTTVPAARLEPDEAATLPGLPSGHRPLVRVHLPANFRLVVAILQLVVDLEPGAAMANDPNDPATVIITVPADHAGFARLGGE